MKTKIIVLLLIFMGINVYGQLSDEGDFPEKYRSVFLGFGPRTLNTTPGVIKTIFTDESPSMDHLETQIEIKDKYRKWGFQAGYKWGRYKGLSHSILFDISMGKNRGGIFTYSLGYNYPIKINSKALVLRGAFFGGFGNFGFDIGQLENNAGYIQINGNKYYDRQLDVSLSSQVLIYGPEIDIMLMMSDRLEVFANFNYDLKNKNSRPKINFTTTELEEEETTSVNLTSENVTVTYNGNKLSSLPYDISGLRLTIGVAYVWNYY